MDTAELQAKREHLVAEIHAAFDGVSRDGGVSWNETFVIDAHGSDEARRNARRCDKDQSWTDLASDETWDCGPGNGGWVFLDPISFRYYLPAAMLRYIHVGSKAATCFSLDTQLTMNKATKPGGFRDREWKLEKWSLLNDRQKRCVAQFVRFMIAQQEFEYHDVDLEDRAREWHQAYERHWKAFDEPAASETGKTL